MDQDQHPHGTVKRYRAGCKCQPCRDAWAAYHREQRAGISHRKPAAGRQLAAAGSSRAGAAEHGTAARLEALWAAEAEADAAGRVRGGAWRDQLEHGDSGHDCPEGHPRRWAGAHTVLVCLKCKQFASSPGAQAREADLGQARARRARAAHDGTAVAERPDSAEARRRRLELRANRKAVAKYLGELLEGLKYAGQLGEAEGNDYITRRAEVMHDAAEGYADEIAQADTLELLGELLDELQNMRAGSEVGELMAFVEQRAAEAERRAALERRQAEARRREAEAGREQRRLEREQQAAEAGQRKQIASTRGGQRSLNGTQRRAIGAGGADAGRQLGQFAAEIIQRQARIKRNGACEIGLHRGREAADYLLGATVYRAYVGWGGQNGRFIDQDKPTIRACRAHFDKAEQRLKQSGVGEITYQELGP